MSCNDKMCIDRDKKHPLLCTNLGCSHSAGRYTFPLHELVSKIIITPECSSGTMKKIEKWQLKPSSFKIGDEWQIV